MLEGIMRPTASILPVTNGPARRLHPRLPPRSSTPRASLSALLLLPVLLGAQTATAPVSRDVLKLEPMKVSGAGIGASEAAAAELTEVYDAQDLEDSGVFDLAEFFDQLPPSPLGEEQLVLVDGQPTYLNVALLPPEMIASIEVSVHGALPQYGAYANGRVINIRLKTNFAGEYLALETGSSFQGDGWNSRALLSGRLKRGPTGLTYGLSYRRQDALLASDRDFSRDQDHTSRGGTDLRLLWGDTAVVRAVTGLLPGGVLDANGQPTAVALVPAGQDGRSLAPDDFLPAQVFPPATVATAAGQRRFNTAEYLTLVTPSEEKSATFDLSRDLSPRLRISLTGEISERTATRGLAPPVTAASPATVVPAAYNPFGQDVQVGLVHTGFGPVRQEDRRTNAQLGLNVSGRWAETWRWHASLGGRWTRSRQDVADLDRAAFAAALAADDPAQRFNPFGDDPRNAALYPQLTVDRASATDNSSTHFNFGSHGEVAALPGGPARLTLNGEFGDDLRDRRYFNPAGPVTTAGRRRENRQSGSISAALPWFGQKNGRTWLRRLETHFNARYGTESGVPGGTINGRLNVLWSPHRAFSLRGTYGADRRAPSRFIADAPALTGETFIDPRRFPATATDVLLLERDFDGAVRARGRQLMLSASFEPPFVPGLSLNAAYDRQEREDLTSSAFRAQDLIYNELTLPGRIVRAAPTEDDLRLGQPGRIVSVDRTPSDRAAQESSGLRWSVHYRRRSETLGYLNFNLNVRHALTQRYEVVPGVPFVFESGNALHPPDWTAQGRFNWNRKGWRLGASYRFVAATRSGTIEQPATRRFGVDLGYRFSRPIWGRWGRGVQVGVEFDNLIEGTPPFADTINGFRSGSPLGRTWSITLRMPLRPSDAPPELPGVRTRRSP